jgi:hypothetical protein
MVIRVTKIYTGGICTPVIQRRYYPRRGRLRDESQEKEDNDLHLYPVYMRNSRTGGVLCPRHDLPNQSRIQESTLNPVSYSTFKSTVQLYIKIEYIKYLFVFGGGELLEVTTSERMSISTRSMTQQVEEELERALDRNAKKISYDNCEAIFQYKKHKTRTSWVLRCCETCLKPNFMHDDPWSEECMQLPITQNLLGEYIEQLEEHLKIQQIARRLEPRPRVNKSQSQVKCNYSHKKTIEETKPQYQKDLEDEYNDPEDGYKDVTEVKSKVKYKTKRDLSGEEKEYRYWKKQIDDFWNMKLHPDDLRKLLENEEKWRRFKHRIWTQSENEEDDECEDKKEEEYEEMNKKEYEEKVAYKEEDDKDESENEYEDESEDEYENEYEDDECKEEKEEEYEKMNKKEYEEKVAYKEEDDKVEKQFSEEEMEEGRCRIRQIDDYLSQNPTERKREEWMIRLHPDDLRKLLEDEEKWGRFKPRNWTEEEWIREREYRERMVYTREDDECDEDEYEDEYEEDDENEYEEKGAYTEDDECDEEECEDEDKEEKPPLCLAASRYLNNNSTFNTLPTTIFGEDHKQQHQQWLNQQQLHQQQQDQQWW